MGKRDAQENGSTGNESSVGEFAGTHKRKKSHRFMSQKGLAVPILIVQVKVLSRVEI